MRSLDWVNEAARITRLKHHFIIRNIKQNFHCSLHIIGIFWRSSKTTAARDKRNKKQKPHKPFCPSNTQLSFCSFFRVIDSLLNQTTQEKCAPSSLCPLFLSTLPHCWIVFAFVASLSPCHPHTSCFYLCRRSLGLHTDLFKLLLWFLLFGTSTFCLSAKVTFCSLQRFRIRHKEACLFISVQKMVCRVFFLLWFPAKS